MALLELKNLHVALEDRSIEIVRGVDLAVDTNQVHAVMGPNGSGKSTLAYALMGHPGYAITDGQILFDGEDVTELAADERAQRGLFLAFQYPHAVPGVTVTSFLRSAINAVRKARAGEDDPVPIPEFRDELFAAMEQGVIAGYPLRGVRATLYDGSYHSVDSSEMAFKVAGSMAFKQAAEEAGTALLEPIMTVTLSVPEESVGDVIGDLNGRRGRPLGMEPKGGVTEVKAEVPMAEMLTYAPDLRAMTAGQGDYTMDFARYEEVPGHLAQKVIAKAGEEKEAAHA